MLAQPHHQLLRLRSIELDRLSVDRLHGHVPQHVNHQRLCALAECCRNRSRRAARRGRCRRPTAARPHRADRRLRPPRPSTDRPASLVARVVRARSRRRSPAGPHRYRRLGDRSSLQHPFRHRPRASPAAPGPADHRRRSQATATAPMPRHRERQHATQRSSADPLVAVGDAAERRSHGLDRRRRASRGIRRSELPELRLSLEADGEHPTRFGERRDRERRRRAAHDRRGDVRHGASMLSDADSFEIDEEPSTGRLTEVDQRGTRLIRSASTVGEIGKRDVAPAVATLRHRCRGANGPRQSSPDYRCRAGSRHPRRSRSPGLRDCWRTRSGAAERSARSIRAS